MDNYDEARGAYELAAKDAERLYEENERLRQNLSSLLSAAEPITVAIKDFTLSDEQGICDESLIHNNKLKDIKAGQLRALGSAVRKIKGEK